MIVGIRPSAIVILLLVFALPHSVLSASGSSLPYTGQASDRSLEATDKARKLLLSDRSAMKNWTTAQWQSWADQRFGVNTSADGSTWQDWRKARIKSLSDHSVLPGIEELNKPAIHWDASDWQMFVDNVDTDYKSSDKYFSVILPNGQDRGTFLLGRWAYAMYEGNLSERQAWEAQISEDDSGTESDSQQLQDLMQMQLEMLCFLAGVMTALIVSSTWRW